MTAFTVTHPYNAAFAGTIVGIVFTAGSGSGDDATQAGGAAKQFFLRQGWAVTGTAADLPTVAEGKPAAAWTDAEIKTYLDANKVQYPSGASSTDLKNALLTAFETRANGGSATKDTGGHSQGTFPVLDAPIVPGDDADKAAVWKPPRLGVSASDVGPAVTLQPSASSKVAPATATYTITVTGTPTPSIQWQRQTRGGGAYNDIPGATNLAYTTPPLSVVENHNDRYRARVSNSDGVIYTNSVQQAVT